MRILLLCLTALFLTSCQMGYIIRSGYDQALLLWNREDNQKVLQDPNIPETTKQKIRLMQEAKEFAEKELGLVSTKNYSSFVDLHRKYVTYIVQAAEPWKLEYYYWSFPIVGKVPYKGYFDKDRALAEEKVLQKEGYDTYVRGVRAFSTLGWFHDPILSSMMDYDEDELVNVVLHETTHATLYIKSSADFNEQLATFVGNKGTELFYLKREGPNSPTLKKIRARNKDNALFSSFITKEIQDLEKWYVDHPEKNPVEKQKRFELLISNFTKIQKNFMTDEYRFFASYPLNNASLLGFKTYNYDLQKFENFFVFNKSSMKEFLERIKTLQKSKQPEKDFDTLSQATPK
jgi:predicted aminopeptidase